MGCGRIRSWARLHPPALVGPEWTCADLELDPYLTDTGAVRTGDWDEFLAALRVRLISHAEQVAARKATAEIEHLLRERAEPFGDVGHGRLESVLAMALQPLADLSSAPTFVISYAVSAAE
jgi:predicted RNA-binding protein associated with RNAse of E/G family